MQQDPRHHPGADEHHDRTERGRREDGLAERQEEAQSATRRAVADEDGEAREEHEDQDGEPHVQRVDPTAVEAGERADHDADQRRQRGGAETDQQ